MSGHHCHRCGSSLHPGAMKCSGCMASVVYGATVAEKNHAAKVGAALMLAAWCYVVSFSLPAIVVGTVATLAAASLFRLAAVRSRAGYVRTVY